MDPLRKGYIMSERIFILDDDETTLTIIKNILESNRLKVSTFSSPNKLIDKLKIKVPRLILLDIMMPDIDGLSLCKEIRKLDGYGEIPIVILSSKISAMHKREAFQVGASGFITKPFTARELVFAIKTYMDLPKII